MTWYDQLLYLHFQKFITHNTKSYFIPCDVYKTKTVCMKFSMVYVEGIEELKIIRMFFLAKTSWHKKTDFYYSVLLIYGQQNLAWRSF